MKRNFKLMCYGNIFISIFLVKMLCPVMPLFLSFEKKEIAAAIVQLELDNEGKDDNQDTKDSKTNKKGFEFDYPNLFGFRVSADLKEKDYHYLSKFHLKVYFPTVPTPPPDWT